ncbi:MAG: deoxyribodipyrimidine photo-lyase [Synechococcus sp. BS301-5m-G54]|nr:deoxyribodipyrimidine photo-lyase [Synechococcus sp. BS301-5m-G54]MBL6795279.1 deoxyribodipyrimidine photo-lyase [Synechococcus sp. BS307-5m-G34]
MPSTPSPPSPGDLPRQFASRDALEALLIEEFPSAEGPLSPIPGGRQAAEARLARVQPSRYAKSRNHLNGAVTGLSPYIRHGVLTLAEVKQAVFQRIRKRDDGGKLINELGWRDFWQRMWLDLGDGIHNDLEAFKTGHDAASYSRELPEDVREGHTGLACMDGFREELVTTGWLHNHARMWMAAWLVHWRRVHWKAGADWFLEHLLDGDPASNHLSWQWVASSFSHKPYFFNRGNLERYSDGRYCDACPSADNCPFEGSYDQLESQLFAPMPAIRDGGNGPTRRDGRGRSGASAALARPKR